MLCAFKPAGLSCSALASPTRVGSTSSRPRLHLSFSHFPVPLPLQHPTSARSSPLLTSLQNNILPRLVTVRLVGSCSVRRCRSLVRSCSIPRPRRRKHLRPLPLLPPTRRGPQLKSEPGIHRVRRSVFEREGVVDVLNDGRGRGGVPDRGDRVRQAGQDKKVVTSVCVE